MNGNDLMVAAVTVAEENAMVVPILGPVVEARRRVRDPEPEEVHGNLRNV
jgi:hypothetical protein